MTKEITVDILDAIKVQWLAQIFEDDFPERGMVAWFTGVEWENKNECYKLYFDFKEFEEVNDKYFREVYYSNTPGKLVTAKVANQYTSKYSVYFSCGDFTTRNDAAFAEEIKKFLKVIE